ncbi:uncharacterized protein LOC135384451 [Ornithodoros turicata]|uniref:uncharacterized protein LOC135384451 n=1 Tax=Ornithodoros turicata TaxID=34597 RepID=UPI0031392C98
MASKILSSDINECIIEEVHARTPLWDLPCKEYKNGQMKQRLWEEIAESLAVLGVTWSVEQVQVRWKNLRDTFARNFRKKRAVRSGSAAEVLIKWPFVDRLMFLKAVIAVGETSGNVSTPQDNVLLPSPSQHETTIRSLGELETAQDILLGMYEDTDTVAHIDVDDTPVRPHEPPPKKKKKPAQGKDGNSVDEEIAKVDRRLEKETDDHEYFALSLCVPMRRCDQDKLMDMRIEIMQVIRSYL